MPQLSSCRFFFLFLAAISLCLPALATADVTAAEHGTVLNLSGRQRMLSQKMSKEVVLVALDVDRSQNLSNLQKTAVLFDTTLKALRDGDSAMQLPATEERRILKQLDKINSRHWVPFYAVIKEILAAKTVNDAQLEAIATQNPALLKQMNKCVKMYEKRAAKAGLKAAPGLAVSINLAGKQRMLTQKMSKEALLFAKGYKVEDNKLNVLETATLFSRTLTGLSKGDPTLDLPGTSNTEIVQQLAIVAKLWRPFEKVMSSAYAPESKTLTPEQIRTVAELNLPLLKAMNKAVGMFAREAAK